VGKASTRVFRSAVAGFRERGKGGGAKERKGEEEGCEMVEFHCVSLLFELSAYDEAMADKLVGNLV